MRLTRKPTAFTSLPEFRSVSSWHLPMESEAVPEAHDHEANIAAALADGYARGVQAGRHECQTEYEAQIADLEKAFDERLADARDQWIRNFSEKAIGELSSVKADLAQSLSDHVAQILEPLVTKSLRENAISSLIAAANHAIDDGSKIRIRAPQEVVQQIKDGLANAGAKFEWDISKRPEIILQIDNTKIQLIFESWLADLEGEGS